MSVTETTGAVEPPQPTVPGPTAGVDWATDNHAVAVVAPDGKQTLRFTINHDAAGLRTLIRRLLAEQVTARVRWRESVASFRALGVATTVEAGGNKVLTGMVKRIDKELGTVSLDSPADIEAFARML